MAEIENEVLKDMLEGMVSILNDAREAYHNGNPIITDEQYDVRMRDLRELEEEVGCVLPNSPTKNSKV